MGLVVTVAGADRTAQTTLQDLEVVSTIAANADMASLKIMVPMGAGWRPMAANEVIISTSSDGTKHFAGMIQEVTELGNASPVMNYIVHAKDYLQLFNKKLFVQEYSAATAADAVARDVVAGTTDGFSSTGILLGPLVPPQKFDYVANGDVMRRLADYSGYIWYIDYNKVVNFVPSISFSAPVASINLDTDITNYGDLDLTETVQNEKNRVYVKGWKQKSSITYNQTFTGDGTSKFFLYGYEPSSIADVTATLNGAPLTVGTDTVDSQAGSTIGSSSSIYICFDNLGARFGNYAPTSTEVLSITANYMTPGFTVVEDLVAQSTMLAREGGDGIHEYAVDDPGVTADDGTDTIATTKGSAILTRDAYPRLTARFKSYTQGWRPGQSLVISSANRMTGFSKTFTVAEVRKRLVNHASTSGSPVFVHDITAIDGALAQ